MRSTLGVPGGDNLGLADGDVAQLVERLDGIQEVARSNRVVSTSLTGFMLGGFVAGEGCFTISTTSRKHTNGEPIKKFVFCVTIRTRDVAMLESLRDFLGVGSISHRAEENPNWEPTSTYTVGSLKAHRQVTIPFAETYLLPCAKRIQFDAWRQDLDAYVERHNVNCGRGRSICLVDGCDRIVRGRGVCRIHYYRVTGY